MSLHKRESQKAQETKKHLLGYIPRKEEIFEPSLSEEEDEMKGIPSSSVMDEKDLEEES